MKKIIFIVLITALITVCCLKSDLSVGISIKQEEENFQDSSLHVPDFISLVEAEKILERHAYLKDSLYKSNKVSLRFQFTYKEKNTDSTSHQIRALFFAFERYQNVSDAADSYTVFKAENKKIFTVTDFDSPGDEGFLAMDKSNCPFIVVRKSNRIFKFRLYNLTDKISSDEIQLVARKIVAAR